MYAGTSHIAEAEVDVLSLGSSWSKREKTRFSNCHMTNGHLIVGSSTHKSQEKETITFCSKQHYSISKNVGEDKDKIKRWQQE